MGHLRSILRVHKIPQHSIPGVKDMLYKELQGGGERVSQICEIREVNEED